MADVNDSAASLGEGKMDKEIPAAFAPNDEQEEKNEHENIKSDDDTKKMTEEIETLRNKLTSEQEKKYQALQSKEEAKYQALQSKEEAKYQALQSSEQTRYQTLQSQYTALQQKYGEQSSYWKYTLAGGIIIGLVGAAVVGFYMYSNYYSDSVLVKQNQKFKFNNESLKSENNILKSKIDVYKSNDLRDRDGRIEALKDLNDEYYKEIESTKSEIAQLKLEKARYLDQKSTVEDLLQTEKKLQTENQELIDKLKAAVQTWPGRLVSAVPWIWLAGVSWISEDNGFNEDNRKVAIGGTRLFVVFSAVLWIGFWIWSKIPNLRETAK